tara:strand:- start:8182 stop:8346 length:165 start_codon:yes stop_codon:yes gene_type:complete
MKLKKNDSLLSEEDANILAEIIASKLIIEKLSKSIKGKTVFGVVLEILSEYKSL